MILLTEHIAVSLHISSVMNLLTWEVYVADDELPVNAQLTLCNTFFSDNTKTVCDIIAGSCYASNQDDLT